jgi:hypothetical protein
VSIDFEAQDTWMARREWILNASDEYIVPGGDRWLAVFYAALRWESLFDRSRIRAVR